MNKLKINTILLGAKTVHHLIKLTNAGEGTALIGKLALKFCPDFIKEASSYIHKEKLVITGTNGKTTTCGLVSHVLKSNNHNIIANSKGANMLTGVANAFALSLNTNKHYDNCVIEADEAYLAQIQAHLNADFILVTNLFRDQVDRYYDINFTKQKIQEGIDRHKDIQLILNADNPYVATLVSDKRPVFYGVKSVIDNTGTISLDFSEENATCSCGKELKYTKKFYAQQGHYHCDCGFSRPFVDYEADVILEKDHSLIKLGDEEFKIPLSGLFNAYNALAAITMLKEIGVTDIQKHLLTYKTTFGRSEIRDIKGHKTSIQLIKNPAGANQVIKNIDLDSNILIIINDNYADGRDISWINDTNFEHLALTKNKIIVSGLRAEDMAKRLTSAGLPGDKIIIEGDIKKAVDYVTTIAENNITILPTYTALLTLNKLWKKI